MKKKTRCILLAAGIMALALPVNIYASRVNYTDIAIIKLVQEKLNAVGFDCGTPDGIAGSGTRQAIQNYRSSKGLSQSEEIDAELFNSLVLNKEQAGFVNAVRDATDGCVGEGEEIKEITLYENDLCVSVDLENTTSDQISAEDLANLRVSSVTDAILELDEYDHLWNTITVDFGSIGEVVNGKDNITDNGYGRYFDSAKFQLTSSGQTTGTGDAASDTGDSAGAGVTPEVKDFLDSYEAFMNEYCDFLESYDASDLSAMTEYLSMMQKYADFAEKADAMDESSMTAEDYKYYIDVTARIEKRLIDVSASY